MPRKERNIFNDVTLQLSGNIKKSNNIFNKFFGKAKDLINQLNENYKKPPGESGKPLGDFGERFRSALEHIPIVGKSIADGEFDRDSFLFVGPVENALDNIGLKAKNVFSKLSKFNKTLLVGLVAIATIAIAMFKSWDESLHNFITGLGVSRKEMKKLTSQARDVYLQTAQYGTTMSGILDVTKGLITNMGDLSSIDQDLIYTTSIIEKTFGMTSDSAAELVAFQKRTLGYSTDQVKDFSVILKTLSDINNVIPGEVMREIASNSEDVAKYSKGTGKNIASAAIFAKKLGVEFSNILGLANSLLDIETSMESAMKAQIFFGTNLNVGLARQQVLQGDILGANRTILSQLSESVDLNNLNVISRQELANILGTTADKAIAMVKNYEKTKDLTQETVDILNGSGDFADKMDTSSVQSNLKQFFHLLKFVFAPFMQPLLDGISWTLEKINFGLTFIVGNMNNFSKSTKEWTKTAQKAEKAARGWIGAFLISGGIISAIVGIKKLGKGIGGVVGGLMKMPGKGAGKFSGFLNSFNPKKMLAAGFAMIELAAATWIMSKAMQQFSTGVSWKGVALGVTSLIILTTVLIGLGIAISAASPAVLLGAAAFAIMGAGIWVVAKAMQGFSKAGQMIQPVLETLKSLNPAQLYGVALGLNAISLALLGFTSTAIILGIGSILTGGVFSKLASDITLMIKPLQQVTNEAHKARMELLSLSGANSTKAVIKSVNSNNKLSGTTGNINVVVTPADVILDHKKVGKIVFDVMRGD